MNSKHTFTNSKGHFVPNTSFIYLLRRKFGTEIHKSFFQTTQILNLKYIFLDDASPNLMLKYELETFLNNLYFCLIHRVKISISHFENEIGIIIL